MGRALAAHAVCARRVAYRHRRRVLLLVQQLLRREIVHRAHLQFAGGVYRVSYVCEASCGVVRATPPGFEHRAHRAIVDDGELGAARRHVEGAHGRRVLDEGDGERIVDEELEDLWRAEEVVKVVVVKEVVEVEAE